MLLLLSERRIQFPLNTQDATVTLPSIWRGSRGTNPSAARRSSNRLGCTRHTAGACGGHGRQTPAMEGSEGHLPRAKRPGSGNVPGGPIAAQVPGGLLQGLTLLHGMGSEPGQGHTRNVSAVATHSSFQ